MRKKIIHAGDRTYTVFSTMEEISKIFEPYGFIRTHSGFFVNFSKICSIGHDDVKLTTGVSIPVSRRNMKSVKEKYLELMRNHGEIIF